MTALGKGLEALLGGGPSAPEQTGITMLSTYMIDNNTDQPRRNFDEDKLLELAESIVQHGVVQPIIVQQIGDRYKIIAGERRFRAARLAGLSEIPVIVREMNEQEVLEVSLIENLQRENLNPVEEARAIKALLEEHDLTQEEVAKRLGKSRPAVANAVRLLALPEELQQMMIDRKLQAGHCRALASIPDNALMIELASRAAEEGWSVRETEQQVKLVLAGNQPPKAKPVKTVRELPSELIGAQDALRDRLGTKVEVKGSEERGKIVIEYFSRDELDGLFEIMMGRSEG